jgi:hypothetical protein
MKKYSTSVRTYDSNPSGNKFKLAKILQGTVYNTLDINGEVNNIEEFLKLNAPLKSSEKLIAAITEAFNNNLSVTFNAGKGNQTFYFQD